MADIQIYDSSALGDAQRRAVLALIESVTRSERHPPLSDHKLIGVLGRGRDASFGVVARAAAGVVAYVHGAPVGRDDTVWNIETVLPRDGRTSELREQVTRIARDESVRRGARRVQWWAVNADPEDDALATRLGLRPWRDLMCLTCELPHRAVPQLKPGTFVRAFRPGADDVAWLDVNARSFAAHPEQHSVDQAELDALMAEPWFDPADFLVAEREADGAIIGFCWTKVPDTEHGEIYVIGVDPERQGGGLGRALVLAGLDRIAAHGVGRATLYVDSDNAPARALYDELGFTLDHVDRAYASEVTR